MIIEAVTGSPSKTAPHNSAIKGFIGKATETKVGVV